MSLENAINSEPIVENDHCQTRLLMGYPGVMQVSLSRVWGFPLIIPEVRR